MFFHVSCEYKKSIVNFDQLHNVLSASETKFDMVEITETKQQVKRKILLQTLIFMGTVSILNFPNLMQVVFLFMLITN